MSAKTTEKTETTETESAAKKAGIAAKAENAKLEHSEGGTTTRDDSLDLGVPMLQGSGDEPVGPEDALGLGAKRGDYTNRIGDSSYHPHETVKTADGVESVPQRPRTEDIGDDAGVKGGTQGK